MEVFNKEFNMVFDANLNVGKTNQEWTPEHFLKCKNVIMGHVGEQKYHVKEFDIKDNDSEFIIVKRTAEDLLSQENIDSVVGKPVTLRHPKEQITPQNISKYQKGSVTHAWADGDKLMGNLIITDEDVANNVWDGKINRLSLGYKAKLVKDDDGKYRWDTRFNNHLAIVKKGRAKEAMIFDSEFEGKEEENMDKETHDLQVDDTVIKTERHEEKVVETTYDTETDEMIEKEIHTYTYRRKPEEKDKEIIASTVQDEQKAVEDLNENEVEKNEKNEKENETHMKTVLDYMKEYKDIQDSFPESEAKVAELKRVNDECLENHKVSLEPKEKEVKDTALGNIKALKEEPVVEEEVNDENLLEVSDEELEMALDEFYEGLDPMNRAVHETLEDGLKHLNRISSANAKTIARNIRKVGNI